MIRFLAICSALFFLAGIAVMVFAPGDRGLAPPPASLGGPVRAMAPAQRVAASVSFRREDGSPGSEADLVGRVVLVNVWATWCGPCIAELGDLSRLQAALGGAGFQVATMATDAADAAAARAFLEAHGAGNLPPLSRASLKPGVVVLPTSLLLDRKGRIAWQGFGPRPWTSPETAEVVRALMAE